MVFHVQISLVIPAYNEEESILATIAEAKTVLAQLEAVSDWEIVVVNDGSSDRTAEMAATQDRVKLVSHPHNAGYGRSLKSGITAASYDTIVITDADLTYPLEQLPNLLDMYSKGFDMVVAARTGVGYQGSIVKTLLRSVLKWLVEFTSGRKIPDINSGLRVFDKGACISYFSHLCDTFSFTTSMTLSYIMTGRFVGYFHIPYRERMGKTKVRLFRDAMRTLQYIIQASAYYNPLKIFILLAGLSFCGSVFGFLLSITYKLLIGYIIGVAGIILAFTTFSAGLIAVLLKQIMDK
jgi:glycosyltransferase involved in cell wall biosynthesis